MFPRGCTTPRVLENIKTGWEEMCDGKPDYSLLDGYDEIPEEFQEKVRRAVENGHIDDEDWKGVSLEHPANHFKAILVLLESLSLTYRTRILR